MNIVQLSLGFKKMNLMWISLFGALEFKVVYGTALDAPITMKIVQNRQKMRKIYWVSKSCLVQSNKCSVLHGKCFEIKIFGHNLIAFGVQRGIIELSSWHSYTFLDHSKWTRNEIWGLESWGSLIHFFQAFCFIDMLILFLFIICSVSSMIQESILNLHMVHP